MTTSRRRPLIAFLCLSAIAFQAGAADAPKRRAWEDAPAEQRAAWERQKAALKQAAEAAVKEHGELLKAAGIDA